MYEIKNCEEKEQKKKKYREEKERVG